VVLDECSQPDDNGHRPVVQARCNHGDKKCRGIYQAIGKNPLLWASLITAAIGASFAIGLYLDDASARFLIRWTLSGTLVGSIVSLQLGRMVSYSCMHRYLKNEAMPTWPFNLKTLQSFAFKLPLGPLGPLAGSNGSVEFLK